LGRTRRRLDRDQALTIKDTGLLNTSDKGGFVFSQSCRGQHHFVEVTIEGFLPLNY
jgi:hypothetical protein